MRHKFKGEPAQNIDRKKPIYLATYATESFRKMAEILGQRALLKGFDGIRIFDEPDLGTGFREKFRSSLELSRGAGYWVWKTEVIRQTFLSLSNDAIIMYLDCGAIPRKTADYYSNLVKDESVHVWMVEGAKLVDWTDCQVLNEIAPEHNFGEDLMVWAGCLIARNSSTLHQVVNLWENLCKNEKYLRPDSFPNYNIQNSVYWHRHDQSLLSILVAIHPELFTVHSSASDGKTMHATFNHHRDLKIKNFSILISFPGMREIRRKIVTHMPTWLKMLLRVIKFRHQMKPISKAEQKAIIKSFNT